jgi:hypothetical protein
VTSLEPLPATEAVVVVLRILERQEVLLVEGTLVEQTHHPLEVLQTLVLAAAVVAVPEAQPLMVVLVEPA